MSEERSYGINWVDLIIKIILLILFVLLICWLFPMPKLDTFYDKVFNENIQTMKEAARNYYTKDRLPKTIGETKKMTLQELINNKLILEFSDKDGNTCDTSSSYVQVTKTLDSEYALKVQLTCGEESDYIIDTIGCNGTCLLSDVNTTKEDDNDDSSSVQTNTSTTGNTNYKNYKGYTGGTTTYYYPITGTTTGTTNNTTTNNTTTNTTTVVKPPIVSGSTNNNSSNNNSSNNSNISTKKLYYQHSKTVKNYGNWIEGYKTGYNIDNKTEQVKYYNYYISDSDNAEYRTTSYIVNTDLYSGKTYSYELQLTDIPSSATSVTLNSNRYFNTADYQKYLNYRNSNLYMSNNDMLTNSIINNATTLKNSSLKKANFDYTLSSPYKSNGVWRVRVTIKIKNRAGVDPYYDYSLGKSVYYAPVYFDVDYKSNGTKKIVDTLANSYKYSGYQREYAYTKTVHYYRYITEDTEYIWSVNRYVSGYTYTGKTEYRY